jgi:hypothetical protein
MRFLLSLIIFLSFNILGLSQVNISGKVVDSKTKEALPYASVVFDNKVGTITNAEGFFNKEIEEDFKSLQVSYVGYSKKDVKIVAGDNYYLVELVQNSTLLNEIVLTDDKIDPAIRVIKNTIDNKKINNPDKILNSYSYNLYNRLIITANPDSIKGQVDTIWTKKDGELIFKRVDSSSYNFKKQITDKHLYLSEKLSKIRFKKSTGKQEEVLGTRMAGFKEPIWELLAFDLQSLSFYDDYYSVFGDKYLNPIAGNKSINHYSYKILDTLYQPHEVYMIYFKAKQQKDVADLEGVLYIDSRKYSVQKAVVELKALLKVSAVMNFEYIDDYGLWFPRSVELNLKKGDNKQSLFLMGNKLDIQNSRRNPNVVRKSNDKRPSDILYMNSSNNYFDLKINENIDIKNSSVDLFIDENASERDSIFWASIKQRPLDNRTTRTYEYVDSIVEKSDLNKAINILRSINNGYWPGKYVDYNLNQIIDYNEYEGLKLGVGLKTSDRISKKFNIEAYGKYGFNDRVPKGFVGFNLRLNRIYNSWISADYSYDYFQSSRQLFYKFDNKLDLDLMSRINNNFLAEQYRIRVHFKTDITAKLKTAISVDKSDVSGLYNYSYINNGVDSISEFKLFRISNTWLWEPNSKHIQTPKGRIKSSQGYPIIKAQYTRSFTRVFESNTQFNKFDLSIHHQLENYYLGISDFFVSTAYIDDAPLMFLNYSTPNSHLRDPYYKRINLSDQFGFETMLYAEFFNNRMIELHYRQSFNNIEISESLKPVIAIVARGVIGTLSNKEKHAFKQVRDLNKGFYEAGLEIKKIYMGLGLGAYYRLGPYSFEKEQDNIFVKVSFKFDLFNL